MLESPFLFGDGDDDDPPLPPFPDLDRNIPLSPGFDPYQDDEWEDLDEDESEEEEEEEEAEA